MSAEKGGPSPEKQRDNVLPCPFCGKQPIHHDNGPVGGGWHVRCICIVAPGVCDLRHEVAVELWNNRAPGRPPETAPTCQTCGHIEEAHTDDGCQCILSMGRYMETDDEYCECTAFVSRGRGGPTVPAQ